MQVNPLRVLSSSPEPHKSGVRLAPCSLRKANDFVEVFHRHSRRTSRDGGKFAVAAIDGASVVGVAIVGNPLSATLMDGFTAEVLRVCVMPEAPRNCNSLLYGACRRLWFTMGGRKILTYTLTDESGISLRGAGWTMAAEICGHSVTTWGKKDHLTRNPQEIQGKAKFRWEAINARADALRLEWPTAVANLHEGGLLAALPTPTHPGDDAEARLGLSGGRSLPWLLRQRDEDAIKDEAFL